MLVIDDEKLKFIGLFSILVAVFHLLRKLSEFLLFFFSPPPPQVNVPLTDFELQDTLPDNFPKFDTGIQ